ncbi:MAG: hypothetical protein QW057_09005 [Candidatus Bathyarchaeia archaeon]
MSRGQRPSGDREMLQIPMEITYPGHPPGSPLRIEGSDLILEPMNEPIYVILPWLERDRGRSLRGAHIVHEETVRKNHRAFQETFRSVYRGDFVEAWAAKSFHTRALFALAAFENASVEVGSLQELRMALDTGIDGAHIICTGPAKDEVFLKAIAETGATAVIENLDEVRILDKIAGKLGRRLHVALRINPGPLRRAKATHPGMLTAGPTSKFGFPLEGGVALKAALRMKEMSGLQLSMVHMHIGSQVASLTPYRVATRRLVRFAMQLREKIGVEITGVDVGGGFAYPYVPVSVQDELRRNGLKAEVDLACELTLRDYAEAVAGAVQEAWEGPLPQLVAEPGRRIVAGAVGTLGQVTAVRRVSRGLSWVFTSISTKEFHQKLLASSFIYQAVIANRADRPAVFPAAIGGELCFAGDVMTPPGVAVLIPEPKRGDYVYFANTGAYSIYGASFSHGIPLMPIVLVDTRGGRHVIRESTDADPLKALDKLPAHLDAGKPS